MGWPFAEGGWSESGERTGSRSTVRGGAWAGAGCLGDCCAPSVSAETNRSKKKEALLQRRIVAGTSMNGERRQSRWRIELHLHFTPLAVPGHVFGRVSNDILIAQFGGNLLGNVAHLSQIIDAEHPS